MEHSKSELTVSQPVVTKTTLLSETTVFDWKVTNFPKRHEKTLEIEFQAGHTVNLYFTCLRVSFLIHSKPSIK
jgi:hypothetical protein